MDELEIGAPVAVDDSVGGGADGEARSVAAEQSRNLAGAEASSAIPRSKV